MVVEVHDRFAGHPGVSPQETVGMTIDKVQELFALMVILLSLVREEGGQVAMRAFFGLVDVFGGAENTVDLDTQAGRDEYVVSQGLGERLSRPTQPLSQTRRR